MVFCFSRPLYVAVTLFVGDSQSFVFAFIGFEKITTCTETPKLLEKPKYSISIITSCSDSVFLLIITTVDCGIMTNFILQRLREKSCELN